MIWEQMTGIINVDKPGGWTSHDVVGKLRGVLRQRRIGHAGTLDPLATGVLPVFIGRATRALEFVSQDGKEYMAGLRLGVATDTQDITGRVVSTQSAHVDETRLRQVLREFTGELMQRPPMYSAVKIDGRRLYELARRGVETDRPERHITVLELELCGREGGDYILRVVCSKGTYVRTLCDDIGRRLGCGGTLASLRRTRSGVFRENDAVTLEEISRVAERAHDPDRALMAAGILKPTDWLFGDLPAFEADSRAESRCRSGAPFECAGQPDGLYRVYGGDGTMLMLGRASGGVMRTVKSFFEPRGSGGGSGG
jgi:tRNA pseudouridine55 synthase